MTTEASIYYYSYSSNRTQNFQPSAYTDGSLNDGARARQ